MAEQGARNGPELEHDLGVPPRHRLARAQVEGHARPAPGVEAQFHRHIGLGPALRIDVRFVRISGSRLVADASGAIAAAHDVLAHLAGRELADRFHDLGLFGPDRACGEAVGRLHADHREQLEQMVGHHVAQGAGRVVELAPPADADGFGGRDLDMVDIAAVPHRFDHRVGEARHHDVANRFLAEIMIDPVDLGLVRQLQQALVERPRRSEIVAERLFDQQPPKAPLDLVEKVMRRQARRDLAEKVRRRCEIESGIARLRCAFRAPDRSLRHRSRL